MIKLSEKGGELCRLLGPILKDKDTYVGTMLMLAVDQEDPDSNYQQLIDFINENMDFIKENPEEGYLKVLNKAEEIVGIEDYDFDDEEDYPSEF